MSESENEPKERVNPLTGIQQFRRLFAFVVPHRGRLFIALAAILATSVAGLAGPYTLQFLIDAVLRQGDAALLNRITLILVASLLRRACSTLFGVINSLSSRARHGGLAAQAVRAPARSFAQLL